MRTPDDLVGSREYLRDLDEQIRRDGFPWPDPALGTTLTEARHVAASAEAAGESRFAEEVMDLRIGPFRAISRFGAAVRELEGQATTADEASARLRERLNRSERSFLDLPGPTQHLVAVGAKRGRAELDPGRVPKDLGEAWSRYADERTFVASVGVGGRSIAVEAYEDTDDFESDSGNEYDSADEYGDVVGFNAALTAETMLEGGKEPLVTR